MTLKKSNQITKVTIENQLQTVAEFMDLTSKDGFYLGTDIKKAGLPFSLGAMGNGTDELKFNKSWDWLMPVIAKMNSECQILDGAADDHESTVHAIEDAIWTDDIIQAYNEVVQFIKWYNNQKAS